MRKRKSGSVAICFDLDGVLIDTMPLHARAWQSALRGAGISVSRRKIYEWEGEPGRKTARRLIAEAGKGLSQAHRRRLVLHVLSDKEERFARIAAHVSVDRSWRRFLGRLSESGVPIALVTGTSRQEVDRVVPEAVLDYFQAIVTGDQVAHGKPHPEPYLKACKRLRVPPNCAIVVENAPYGIRSAKAAGIGFVAALASSLPASFLLQADAVYASAHALRAELRRLVRGRESLSQIRSGSKCV